MLCGSILEEGPFMGACQPHCPPDPRDAEIADLKELVVAFCGPWAAQFAKEWGLPKNHLHPTHYDILARCGARMDDFTRAELEPQP